MNKKALGTMNGNNKTNTGWMDVLSDMRRMTSVRDVGTNGLPHVFWVEITPDLARKILDRCNTDNYRGISSHSVGKYASDMKADEWGITHQGICFSKRGVLLDGQHRLMAIVESDTTQIMMVVFACEDVEAMDTGRIRSLHDSMVASLDHEVSRDAARLVASSMAIFRNHASTRHQMLDFYRKHRESIDATLRHYARCSHINGVRRMGIWAGVFGGIVCGVSDGVIEQFACIMSDGQETDNPASKAARKFRENMMTSKKTGGLAGQTAEAKITQRLLVALSHREIVSFIRPPAQMLFPIKDEA